MYSWLLIFHRFRPGQLRNQHGKERSQFFFVGSRILGRWQDVWIQES